MKSKKPIKTTIYNNGFVIELSAPKRLIEIISDNNSGFNIHITRKLKKDEKPEDFPQPLSDGKSIINMLNLSDEALASISNSYIKYVETKK